MTKDAVQNVHYRTGENKQTYLWLVLTIRRREQGGGPPGGWCLFSSLGTSFSPLLSLGLRLGLHLFLGFLREHGLHLLSLTLRLWSRLALGVYVHVRDNGT